MQDFQLVDGTGNYMSCLGHARHADSENIEDGNEVIVSKPGDYAIRTGITSRPLTEEDLTIVLPPLHAKLCLLRMFEQLLYRYRY